MQIPNRTAAQRGIYKCIIIIIFIIIIYTDSVIASVTR